MPDSSLKKASAGFAYFVEFHWKGNPQSMRSFWTHSYESTSDTFRFSTAYVPRVCFSDDREMFMRRESFETEPIDRKLQAASIKKLPEPLWMQKTVPVIYSSLNKEPDKADKEALRKSLEILDLYR